MIFEKESSLYYIGVLADLVMPESKKIIEKIEKNKKSIPILMGQVEQLKVDDFIEL